MFEPILCITKYFNNIKTFNQSNSLSKFMILELFNNSIFNINPFTFILFINMIDYTLVV